MGLYNSLGNEYIPPTRWGCKLQSNVNPALGRTGSPQNEIIVVVVVVVVVVVAPDSNAHAQWI